MIRWIEGLHLYSVEATLRSNPSDEEALTRKETIIGHIVCLEDDYRKAQKRADEGSNPPIDASGEAEAQAVSEASVARKSSRIHDMYPHK